MKNLILLFISLWFCAACMTTRRIEKHCDDFAKICITEAEIETETDTTRNTETEITKRDTTAIIYIPEETIKDKKPVTVVDEEKKPVPVVKKEYVNSELSVLTVPFARSYAQVVNSELIHELVQTDTLLRIQLENALIEKKILTTELVKLKQKKIVTITIKENSGFAKFCIKVFWGLLIVSVLGIGYLIFRFRVKLLGLFKK